MKEQETLQAMPDLMTEAKLRRYVALHNLMVDKPKTWTYLLQCYEADPAGLVFPLTSLRGNDISALRDDTLKKLTMVRVVFTRY